MRKTIAVVGSDGKILKAHCTVCGIDWIGEGLQSFEWIRHNCDPTIVKIDFDSRFSSSSIIRSSPESGPEALTFGERAMRGIVMSDEFCRLCRCRLLSVEVEACVDCGGRVAVVKGKRENG